MPLDEWQEQVLEAALGERSDGRWAAKYIGLSAPRQNGKSQLIVARALAGILLFGERMIIISAHETDTAREIWRRLLDVVESNPNLEDRVTGRMDAINREFLAFGRGDDRQVIKMKARRSTGTRGFSCDCLLLDEAQILGKQAWGSINPTVSAMPNPQIWMFGTPPTIADDPFAFSRVRDSAQAHRARHAWLEWSARPGDDLDDPETWARANPAFGIRISAEACADDRAAMDDEQFAMERLGMWATESLARVIDSQSWMTIADPASMPVERLSLAIDVAPDRSVAAVSLAGKRADDLWHVELDEHRRGADWVIGWVRQRAEKNRLHAVVMDEMSGLVEWKFRRPMLKGTDIEVTLTTARDMGIACAKFYDAVMSAELRHTDQPQVNVALSVAGKREISNGAGWAWNKKTAEADISPTVAQTLALWGAQNDNVSRPVRNWTRNGGGGWVA